MKRTSFSILNFSNQTAWILVFAITLVFSIFILGGPAIYSEIEDAPSFGSKLFYISFVFFVLGSFLVPIKRGISINLAVFTVGVIAALLKIAVGLYNVTVHNQSLLGFLALSTLLAIVGFFYYKKLKFR